MMTRQAQVFLNVQDKCFLMLLLKVHKFTHIFVKWFHSLILGLLKKTNNINNL